MRMRFSARRRNRRLSRRLVLGPVVQGRRAPGDGPQCRRLHGTSAYDGGGLRDAAERRNAFDAGVAAMLVGGVVEQDLYSLGGEGLVLVYPRSSRKVVSVVGQGWAPKAATIDWYISRGKTWRGSASTPRSSQACSTRR